MRSRTQDSGLRFEDSSPRARSRSRSRSRDWVALQSAAHMPSLLTTNKQTNKTNAQNSRQKCTVQQQQQL